MRKRISGAPQGGVLSIVVTDIEGFSGGFVAIPGVRSSELSLSLSAPCLSYSSSSYSCLPLPFILETSFPSSSSSSSKLLPLLHAEMMKRTPELMMPALVTHNNLIRIAKWSNYGFTIEQEGDSYAIVFREASDAVKFCLQVREGVCVCVSCS